MKLYSFDVFDTLITRCTATPQGVFAIMQSRIKLNNNAELNEYVIKNFCMLRVGAEQVARNTICNNGIEDVTLEQIYYVLVKQGHISAEQSIFLQRLEKRTEFDFSVGILENISKVRELICAGERVVLISDMYLDVDTIRNMLMKEDDIFNDIPIYVSSGKEKKNKWSGNLFRLVQEWQQVSFSEWEHFGDNEYSDYKVPKRMGIVCLKYVPEKLLQIEELYLKNNEFNAEVQLSLGCAKVARMKGKKNTAYRMGCSIGGNILYKYVCWLLEDSIKRNIKRLYFIARDGYALKELANALIQQNGYQIEVRYIFGSRLAWRIPSDSHFEKEIWDIYTHSYQDRIFSIKDLADFFQIQEEALCKYLSTGLRDSNRIWTVEITDFIVKQLLHCHSFIKELKTEYDKKRKLLIGYLQQQIDTSDEKFAFVDLAGSGFTQECLAQVMAVYYHGEIKNYFFRQDKTMDGICQNFVFYPNYISYFILLEMVSRAPHGQTIGYYEDEDGKIMPVLSEIDNQSMTDHHVEDFIKGIMEYGIIYDCKRRLGQIPLEIGNIFYYLDYIYNTPDREVLDFFADMPNMLTGREIQTAVFAPALTNKDIRDIYLYREGEALEFYYMGTDIVYSLRRCTKQQLNMVEKYGKYRNTWYGKVRRRIHKYLNNDGMKIRTATIYDCIMENIVIYGAGKKGKLFYEQITGKRKVKGQRYYSNIVKWVDQNYKQYQQVGMDVTDPEELYKVRFDQIIITVAKREVANDIKSKLLEKGIEEYKIIWINPVK